MTLKDLNYLEEKFNSRIDELLAQNAELRDAVQELYDWHYLPKRIRDKAWYESIKGKLENLLGIKETP